MTQTRQFLGEMITIPPGRVEDRGTGLGWNVLDARGPALVGKDTVLVDEGIVFGDKATTLEEEGRTLEGTVVLGRRLSRKARVRSYREVSPCMSNRLTPAMFIFLTQAAFIPRESVSSYEITCPAQSERRKGVAEQLSQPRVKPDDSDGRKDPS